LQSIHHTTLGALINQIITLQAPSSQSLPLSSSPHPAPISQGSTYTPRLPLPDPLTCLPLSLHAVAAVSKSRFDKPIVPTTEDRPTVKAFQAEVEAAQAKRRQELAAAAAAAHAAEVGELGDKVDELELSGSEDEHGTLLVSCVELRGGPVYASPDSWRGARAIARSPASHPSRAPHIESRANTPFSWNYLGAPYRQHARLAISFAPRPRA